MYQKKFVNNIRYLQKNIKYEIHNRSCTFRKIWLNGSQKDIFLELIFCILTPQSKAEPCWEAACEISKKNLLLKGSAIQIQKILQGKGPRFHRNKAKYIIQARKFFSKNKRLFIKDKIKEFADVTILREWIAKNVKGLGFKEASHFLRNIYIGKNLAILDRHILKNLKLLGVIKEIPQNLSEKKYIAIEKKMQKFAKYLQIPMFDLDFILWYKEAGKVFK